MTRRSKMYASGVAAALIAAIAGLALTFSAFTSATTNADNSFAAGTVKLADNSAGTAMFTATGLQPGDSQSKCITVSYAGTLRSSVKLYGVTTNVAAGSGGLGSLAPYLHVKIVRGSFAGASPAAMACTGFTADSTGATLFDSTLDTLASTYSAGIADPHTPWVTNDTAVYQVTYTLTDNDAAQGKDASTALSFEARNVASQL